MGSVFGGLFTSGSRSIEDMYRSSRGGSSGFSSESWGSQRKFVPNKKAAAPVAPPKPSLSAGAKSAWEKAIAQYAPGGVCSLS